MGNVLRSTEVPLVCHDTIETCKTQCGQMECIFLDQCNDLAKKYACLPINPINIMWIIVAAAIITIVCCSSLVAFYIIRAVRASYRIQRDNAYSREVVFNRPARVHHIHMDGSPRHYRKGPHARY